MNLTSAHRQILNVLAEQPMNAPLTAREIAAKCEHRSSNSDWAHGKLRKLEARGFVEKIGVAFDGARTWRITDAGREARLQRETRS